MMKNIKICPFCGSEAKVVEIEIGDNPNTYFAVRCEGDGEHQIDYLADTPEEAIEEWNKRHVEEKPTVETFIYTATGFGLYCWFKNVGVQGIVTTDPNEKYSLPDGTLFSSADHVEDWFIRMAEQIKSERQKIIMNNVVNKEQ